jgi:hypothetical protein
MRPAILLGICGHLVTWFSDMAQFNFLQGFLSDLYIVMKKEEVIMALRALAKKHPYAENVGYKWKNPLNPKSTGIRWSTSDLNLFKKLQKEYR